ncbi:hypothetical protein LTR62_004406 [Meristemomyces frigidus]|uniref:Heme haloperoxidase family profile domain-containing protein n=1 Tax=Meristemomyces frigidus TaxID=1508187 RepID=A0AAN7TM79_9PEZI|nr:hypothetical protein LTR62_004406 [Meristemomyces frigidus]
MLDALPEGEDSVASFDSMGEFAAARFQQSISSNPHFFYGPFTGLVGRNAGYAFISRFFANHSSVTPLGQLNHNILQSFYGLTNKTYTYGHERIPENWYKRSTSYDLVDLNVDILAWTAQHPEFASVGGNTGSVNSFSPLDLENLTGGILNSEKLLEGSNLICFALEFVKLAAPSFTNNLFGTLSAPSNILSTSLSIPLLSLECPQWDALTGGGKDVLTELSQYSIPGVDQGLL